MGVGSTLKRPYYFIKGLGVPTEFSNVIRYLAICSNNTSNIRKVIIENDNGGKLIYENTARWKDGKLTDDGWYHRYEDKDDAK